MRSLIIIVAVAMASLAAPAAQASEGRGQPFITAADYQKNISLKDFRVNPRGYFVNESAFRLIVKYVGDEIGQPLSAAQFVALVKSNQVRVRSCAASESINTGALSGDQFHWFTRGCRQGEEIVQVLATGRWIDVISLNCLNAVEDPTPVPPPNTPLLVSNPPATPVWQAPPPSLRVTVTYREGISVAGGTYISGCCGCINVTTIQGVSISGSSSTQIIY